jgi:hypothetical protein
MDELAMVVADVKAVAKRYAALTGKPLGVTGEIAELEAARLLGVRLADARQAGYDAIRVGQEGEEKIQIKGRCFAEDCNPGQRMGSIRFEHPWDAALLVLLDKSYDATAIYEARRAAIEVALKAPGSKARNERGALSVSKFISIGKMVWSKSTGRV